MLNYGGKKIEQGYINSTCDSTGGGEEREASFFQTEESIMRSQFHDYYRVTILWGFFFFFSFLVFYYMELWHIMGIFFYFFLISYICMYDIYCSSLEATELEHLNV